MQIDIFVEFALVVFQYGRTHTTKISFRTYVLLLSRGAANTGTEITMGVCTSGTYCYSGKAHWILRIAYRVSCHASRGSAGTIKVLVHGSVSVEHLCRRLLRIKFKSPDSGILVLITLIKEIIVGYFI